MDRQQIINEYVERKFPEIKRKVKKNSCVVFIFDYLDLTKQDIAYISMYVTYHKLEPIFYEIPYFVMPKI